MKPKKKTRIDFPGPVVPGVPVVPVLRRLGRALHNFDEPAVEKISEDTREDPFQVLISTMLSAQTQDPVTAAASARLFRVARTPRTMARLATKRIQRLIFPVSFYRNKARHVRETCRQLIERFGGRVPDNMDELLTLPGVGRKTANLVLILSHGSRDNICVDTHVHRISNRLGWVRTKTPDQTEQALYKAVPRRWWPQVNLFLVTWGQNVCRPIYPRCGACVVSALCPRVGVTRVSRTDGRRAAPTFAPHPPAPETGRQTPADTRL
jgi:endonuclease-3